MEQLQKAKTVTEGWMTGVSKKLNSLLVRDPPPTPSELVEALEEFDKRLVRLEEVQIQIESEIDPDQLESYLDQADAARQKARQTRLLCANRLKEISVPDKDKDSTDSETPSVQAKLLKLELTLVKWQNYPVAEFLRSVFLPHR